MRKFLFFIACALLALNASAQQKRQCKFVERNDWDNPKKQQRLAVIERFIQSSIASNATQRTKGTVYKIPVIVHVIHNGEPIGTGTNISTEQVYSQIDVLNEDFRKLNADLGSVRVGFQAVAGDAEVEFVLATEDPDGNVLSEPGIHRYNGGKSSWDDVTFDAVIKPKTSYDPYKYANFWTANLSGGVLGYAQFPQYTTLPGLDIPGPDVADGVVMGHKYFGSIDKVRTAQLQDGAPYNLGRTATHEVGHWLGLRHLWGDGACSATDHVADTPSQESEYGGCPGATEESCGSLDMWENFMDYTNDECMGLFTEGQVTRMRTVITTDKMRSDMVASTVPTVDVPRTPFTVAAFSASNTESCSFTTIDFTDNSFVALGTGAVTVTWTFEGGTPSTATGDEVSVSYNSFGSFDVQLIATSASGVDTLLLEDYITVQPPVLADAKTLPYAEDFEASSALAEWENDGIWAITSSGSNSTSSVYFNNFDNDTRNEEIFLSSPTINVSDAPKVLVSFDVAYAIWESGASTAYDSLAIYADDGCGNNRKVWQSGGEELATALPSANSFTPSSTEWKPVEVVITDLSGQDILQVQLVSIGGYGNNVYVDNLNVDVSLSTDLDASLKVFPNPNDGSFKVDLSSYQSFTEAKIQVYDLAGRIILDAKASSFTQQEISLKNVEDGMYVVKLNVDGQIATRKILITE